ncbi:cell division topological specificity factor MinE [Mesorhizobium sp.]|uniref:cell division topological specificity factor MinE n=1 Tax=Mesorhizobium sp. TaxID=1871066 RepID=UPI003BA846BA
MMLLDLFKRRRSAPVARERLQVLLAYERRNRNQPDLVSILREEIMAVIARHVQIDQDYLQVSMDRGETMSTLEIDIQIPNKSTVLAAQSKEMPLLA